MADPNARDADTETLVQRARMQDRGAIEQLLVRQLPGLEAFVRLRMGEALRARATPPDMVQSICREVLEDLSGFQYRGEASFRHWLYTCAENKLRQAKRFQGQQKRNPAREVALGDPSTVMAAYHKLCTPSQEMQAREAVVAIERAFDQLPEDYRQAITLAKLCGLSHAEIATHMGRSEGAVRNLVYRGISRLALLVERGGDPVADPD